MTSHIVTSHGADFFGQDHHPCRMLISLARYAQSIIPAADRKSLVQLLTDAQTGTERIIPAAQAAVLAAQLRQIGRDRFVKAKAEGKTAMLLADAATRAAADGDPWEWHTEAAASR
ncbi:hypothetical protein [Streptomyces subrutilus]|uniref:DUF7739 domain-containing protein n=1 Tax=Streptomyces subrutilus TaxID=36818 RepID=UPI002E1361B4|nr:hypothetical protein OG479_35130 [Streptomyces subrutilus]